MIVGFSLAMFFSLLVAGAVVTALLCALLGLASRPRRPLQDKAPDSGFRACRPERGSERPDGRMQNRERVGHP